MSKKSVVRSEKVTFTLQGSKKRQLRAKLAARGLKQSDLFKHFVQAFLTGGQSGREIGLEISVKELKTRMRVTS